MIPEEIRKTLLAALETASDDSLERAQWAFKGMTPQQLAQPYGKSGSTCQEILDVHQAARDRVERAKAWLNALDVGGGQ